MLSCSSHLMREQAIWQGAVKVDGDLVSRGRINISKCHARAGSSSKFVLCWLRQVIQLLPVGIFLQGRVLDVWGDVGVPRFPKNCGNGILDLDGVLLVEEQTTIQGSCKVRAANATVLLEAPLAFEGHLILAKLEVDPVKSNSMQPECC